MERCLGGPNPLCEMSQKVEIFPRAGPPLDLTVPLLCARCGEVPPGQYTASPPSLSLNTCIPAPPAPWRTRPFPSEVRGAQGQQQPGKLPWRTSLWLGRGRADGMLSCREPHGGPADADVSLQVLGTQGALPPQNGHLREGHVEGRVGA